MSPEQVLSIAQQAMQVMLMLALPILLTALIIGLIVSIFQAATQINEMTLSFIPKFVGIILIMILGGPWMLSVLTDYTRELFMTIPTLVN